MPACRSLCLPGSLDPGKVKGKIVVCVRGVNARVEKGFVVKQAGGVGMVLCNDASTGDTVLADAHVLAAAHCAGTKSRRQHSAHWSAVSDYQRGEGQRREPTNRQLVRTHVILHSLLFVVRIDVCRIYERPADR